MTRTGEYVDRFWMWLAWWLPRGLVKWAAIRMFAEATTGTYEDEGVPRLKAMDALERWDG